MKEIILKFNIKTGECLIEAKGFKGSFCEEATKFLRDTLGKTTDFKRKIEWYEKNLKISENIKSYLCG